MISQMLCLVFSGTTWLNDIWKYQRRHVKCFVDHCLCCQIRNVLKIPIHAHGLRTSIYSAMDCWNIDFIGPFPDRGYFLVIVRTFTRWVDLYAIIDATAQSTVDSVHRVNLDLIEILTLLTNYSNNFSPISH